MKGSVFEVNREILGWYWTLFSVAILLILTWELRYSLKKEGGQNKGALMLKWRVETFAAVSIGS